MWRLLIEWSVSKEEINFLKGILERWKQKLDWNFREVEIKVSLKWKENYYFWEVKAKVKLWVTHRVYEEGLDQHQC